MSGIDFETTDEQALRWSRKTLIVAYSFVLAGPVICAFLWLHGHLLSLLFPLSWVNLLGGGVSAIGVMIGRMHKRRAPCGDHSDHCDLLGELGISMIIVSVLLTLIETSAMGSGWSVLEHIMDGDDIDLGSAIKGIINYLICVILTLSIGLWAFIKANAGLTALYNNRSPYK